MDARDALYSAQRCIELPDFMAREQFANAGGRVKSFRQTNFAGICERLHTRRNIDGLPEIVEILVESHCDGRPTMGAHFQDDVGLAALAIELANCFQDVERRSNAINRAGECCHHGVADGFHNGTGVLMGGRPKQSEMFSHQGIGIEIPEALIEGRRTLQISEQKRYLAYAKSFRLVYAL